MKQIIDINSWNRKEHFYFFSKLDDPFWGITTTVDFTKIYLRCPTAQRKNRSTTAIG